MPDLIGQELAQVRGTLADANLKLGKGYQAASDPVAKGRIIKQNPRAGTRAKLGSPVNTTVSSGPRWYIPIVNTLEPWWATIENMERTETKISRDLLEEVRRRAAEEGRDEAEVIEDAVSRYLEDGGSRWEKARSMTGLLEEMREWRRERGVPELSEEEAMRLANEELRKLRRGE